MIDLEDDPPACRRFVVGKGGRMEEEAGGGVVRCCYSRDVRCGAVAVRWRCGAVAVRCGAMRPFLVGGWSVGFGFSPFR